MSTIGRVAKAASKAAKKAKKLDMSKAARMKRAKEQGFDVEKTWYHGTREKFDEFDPDMAGKNSQSMRDIEPSIMLHSNFDEAEFYTLKQDYDYNIRSGDSPEVLDLLVKRGNFLTKETDDFATNYFDKNARQLYAESDGMDGILVKGSDGDQLVIFDPSQIRSVNAAFDPDEIGSSKVMANYAPLAVGGAGAAMMLGGEEAQAGQFTPEQQAILDRVKARTQSNFSPEQQEIIDRVKARITPEQLQSDVPLPPEDIERLSPEQKQQYFGTQEPQEFTPDELRTGRIEAAKTLGTALTTGIAGQFVGSTSQAAKELVGGEFGSYDAAQRVARSGELGSEAGTYIPKTPAGIQALKTIGEVMEPIGHIGAALSPMAASGLGTMARASVPQVASRIPQIETAVKSANQKIKTSLAKRAERYGADKSAGAAATPEALQRVTTAEGLPVPVKLTKGAALRNADDLAFEKEQMKTAIGGPLRDRIEENNLQILQNFDEMVDRTGASDVYAGKSAVGRSVSRAFREGYDESKAKVRRAYEAANNSAEASARVDSRPLIDYINSQITGEKSVAVVDSLRKHITKNNLGYIDDFGELRLSKRLTMREAEQLRKAINSNVTMEKADIGQAARMKALIDAAQDEAAGPLYKKARALRAQQSRIFENRAYIARLVESIKNTDDPKVPYDKVFDKTILNASPQEIKTIRRVLNASGDDGRQAWSELQASTINHIMEKSTSGVGTDSAGNPLVSPAQLNRVINTLDSNGRLDEIFGPTQAQVLRDLNDVAKYVNTVPPGTLINSSGTAAVILGAMAEMTGTAAATGVPVPLITTFKILRDQAKDRKIKRKIQDTLDYANKLNEGK